ncbi:MAG: pyridoxal-phosphate dependent enzyme, partial [Desulfofustis sp.]
MTVFACLDCGEPHRGVSHFRCQSCGGIYGLRAGIHFDPKRIETTQPGIWRYRQTFGLPENAPVLHLGEGGTPLVAAEVDGFPIWLKLESSNPTGSYKDRLASVMVSLLAAEGVESAVEDSSGNAGAAFAAFCARAAIQARVFIPESAAGPKRAQIERFGAEVVAVPGPRQAAAEAVLAEADRGAVYASHAFLPHGLTGVATIAYELVDQLGCAPGVVITPVGHGGLLLGIVLGFQAMQAAGVIKGLPNFIGVQAAENAPLWAASKSQQFQPGNTIAGGIAVTDPVRAPELLKLHRMGVVNIGTVNEEEIRAGQRVLTHQGFDAELTSSVVVDAYRQ